MDVLNCPAGAASDFFLRLPAATGSAVEWARSVADSVVSSSASARSSCASNVGPICPFLRRLALCFNKRSLHACKHGFSHQMKNDLPTVT